MSLMSPALADGFFATSATWEALVTDQIYQLPVYYATICNSLR